VSGKPISEAELKDEQTNSTLALPGSFESVQQLSVAYSNILQYGLPDDYYNTFTQKVLAVTPDAANEIAKKYIQPSHLVWIIVGDMSKVEAGIRELNIGQVHKIDPDGKPVQ
jgi:zinc protease